MGERERLMEIGKKIKEKRVETESVKTDRDSKKDKQDKQDKLAKVVKDLTKAEYDALPKSLQKELKDFR